MNRLLLALAAVLWFTSPVMAQDYPILHYTINSGLPSGNIYQVFRDSRGYLWLATDKGVARYNGVKFEKFTTFNGLADNEVFMFAEDVYGRIWMASYNGALCYYQNDSFHTSQNTPFLRLPFKYPFICAIAHESDSSLTFNYYDRSVLVNIKKDKCTVIQIDSLSKEKHSVILGKKLTNGTYAIYNKCRGKGDEFNSNIQIVDTTGKVINVIGSDQTFFSCQAKVLSNQNSTFITEENGGVYSDDGKLIKRTSYPFSDSFMGYTFYDDGTNYFIGSKNGLYINDSIHMLKGKWVVSVSTDAEGDYWIGTLGDGLYCLRENFMRTRIYNSVYRNEVFYSQEHKGSVFFATADNSLFRISKEKITEIFNYEEYKRHAYTYPNDAAYVITPQGNYYSIYDKDIVVLRSVFSGAPAVNISDNKYLWGTSPKTLLLSNGYLYLKGRHGIYRVPEADAGNYSAYKLIISLMDKGRIFNFTQSPDGSIWYSTLHKVYKIEDKQGIVQPQFGDESFKLFGFFGSFLVGYTHYNRLLVCRAVGDKMRIDTVPDQNCIWDKLYHLDDDHILISTDNLYMLLTLHPDNARQPYTIASIEDPFIPLFAESVCADSNVCYFFKDGSITAIDIKSLLERSMPPKLFFSSLKTSRNSLFIRDEMNVSFEEAKNISISFSTLTRWGKNIAYQYSITRDDNDHWRDLAGETISLVSPGYGDYTIKIRAKSIASGYGSPAKFILHIKRPFWATWWFIVFGIIIMGCIVGAVLRIRIVFILRKNKRKHETEIKFMKSEYKALNALMNPHFIFNTLNNVQSLFNENDKIAANTYLRVFADLVRQNMHNVSKELITLQKEIELVTNYLLLEKLRFEDELIYTIDIDRNIDLTDVYIPPLLIQPIVENSIKHGILHPGASASTINIHIYERDELLHIEVKDNGGGINHVQKNATATHESIGLANIKKRIEQLSIIQNKNIVFDIRDIMDSNNQVVGTVASITMPFS